jgi:enoyl-CoA hydratase/carnithine racemase
MNSPLLVTRFSSSYWRVTIDNPPINLFTPDMRNGFRDLADELEAEEAVKVVVFDSANPRYFISHVDLATRDQVQDAPGPAGLPAWPDFTIRMSRAPFITVASVRGRARGVGSEFLQAMDIRFASKELAILGQPEIGFGFMPGGGGMERLWRLVGRSRALEVITSGDDYDAETAERYGWVNRAVPDASLDSVVDRFAQRVAAFDRATLATIKQTLNEYAGTAEPAELVAGYQKFLAQLSGPAAKTVIERLMSEGLQTDGDVELNLADHLVPPTARPREALRLEYDR